MNQPIFLASLWCMASMIISGLDGDIVVAALCLILAALNFAAAWFLR